MRTVCALVGGLVVTTAWGQIPSAPTGCPNDFSEAANGAGGERLPRFVCVAAPEGGSATAFRVRLKTMYNTTPGDPDGANVCPAGRPLSAYPKPGLDQFEGHVRWVGAPTLADDNALLRPPDYIVAPLECSAEEAEVRDWSEAALVADFPSASGTGLEWPPSMRAGDRFYLFGSEVIPCSVYEVAQCSDPLDEATCSAPVALLTGTGGDCWPPFDPAFGQPDFIDIGRLVWKFKWIGFSYSDGMYRGGPPEWHALLRGNVVADFDEGALNNQSVQFIDLGFTVSSFKSLPYAQHGPCNPDTGLDNCGNPCDTTPGD